MFSVKDPRLLNDNLVSTYSDYFGYLQAESGLYSLKLNIEDDYGYYTFSQDSIVDNVSPEINVFIEIVEESNHIPIPAFKNRS